MKYLCACLAACAALALGACAPASDAPDPSCTETGAAVQRLICGDEGIADLDRQMVATYQAAEAKTHGDGLMALQASQRGWEQARDACRMATDHRKCVKSIYESRISELQATYDLVDSLGPFDFTCADGTSIVATFYKSLIPTAHLRRGDQALIVFQGRSGSGARYIGRNVLFWNKGDDAQVTWQGHETTCTTTG